MNDAVPFHPEHLRFWALGPVLKPAYDAFKVYGSQTLFNKKRLVNDVFIKEIDDLDITAPDFRTARINGHEDEVKKAIIYTLRTIGKESATDLVNRTHDNNSAWSKWYDKEAKDELAKDKYHNGIADKQRQYTDKDLETKLNQLHEELISDIMIELAHYDFFSREADNILN